MYKSPINIIYKDIQAKQECLLLQAIQECGIDVDKDELIKALDYDRRQYDKGFRDGYEKGLEEAKIKAWCEKHCHPGALCPDGYCIEAREGAKK